MAARPPSRADSPETTLSSIEPIPLNPSVELSLSEEMLQKAIRELDPEEQFPHLKHHTTHLLKEVLHSASENLRRCCYFPAEPIRFSKSYGLSNENYFSKIQEVVTRVLGDFGIQVQLVYLQNKEIAGTFDIPPKTARKYLLVN